MIDVKLAKRELTLKEYNDRRLHAFEILTGKEYRRLRRKEKRRGI